VSIAEWEEPAAAAEPSPIAAEFAAELDAVVASKISFATHQNAVPVLRELRVFNAGESLLEDLIVEIETDPPVIVSRTWRVDRIAAGGTANLTNRDVALNAALLMELSEAVRARVILTVRRGGTDGPVLVERTFPVELLARNEWGGSAAMPELLAAFVQPNDPAISRVLKAASEVLRRGRQA
jgi:hypothetical protein